MLVDPKSVKKIDTLNVIFTNLGTGCIQNAHKTLMKLSVGLSFIRGIKILRFWLLNILKIWEKFKLKWEFHKKEANRILYFSSDFISSLKLRCDERFTHAFTACGCVFKEITLVGSNQGNFFENATACSKRTLKTTVANLA